MLKSYKAIFRGAFQDSASLKVAFDTFIADKYEAPYKEPYEQMIVEFLEELAKGIKDGR